MYVRLRWFRSTASLLITVRNYAAAVLADQLDCVSDLAISATTRQSAFERFPFQLLATHSMLVPRYQRQGQLYMLTSARSLSISFRRVTVSLFPASSTLSRFPNVHLCWIHVNCLQDDVWNFLSHAAYGQTLVTCVQSAHLVFLTIVATVSARSDMASSCWNPGLSSHSICSSVICCLDSATISVDHVSGHMGRSVHVRDVCFLVHHHVAGALL